MTYNLKGWLPDRPDHRDLIFKIDARVPPPGIVDNVALYPRLEDQGDLGSCVGHCCTSAGEMLAKRLNLVERNFSRLQSYYYARLQGGFPAGADTGCYVRDGVKAAVKYGFCPERLWRYDISKFSEEPSAEARSAALRNQVKLYSRCRGIPAIRMAIAEGYPVIGGFAVPENILSDECSRTGVIQFPSPNEAIIGGHAVLFVGYDNSKQLIKFQNSWGAGWGDGGCGYLPYRFVWSKLAMDFWALQSEEGKLSPGNL